MREPGDLAVEAEGLDGSRRSLRLDALAAELIRRGPGQRLAYVTDAADTPGNVAEMLELARDADVFFCEAPFLEADKAEAQARRHLTARRAGEIARAAGAKRLAPFHLSPRYQGREREILQEAGDAFGGPIIAPPFEPSVRSEDGP